MKFYSINGKRFSLKCFVLEVIIAVIVKMLIFCSVRVLIFHSTSHNYYKQQ